MVSDDSNRRYRCIGFGRISTSGGLSILISPLTKSTHMLGADMRLLGFCTAEFRTLDEYAEAIRNDYRFAERAHGEIRRVLSGMIDAGLLVSESGIRDACLVSASSREISPTVSTLGIVTRERPMLLERAAASFAANVRSHGRQIELAGFDDTPDEAGRRDNRQRLRDVSKRWGVPCSYAGLDEKRRFVSALSAKTQVPQDVIAFALLPTDGWPSGAGTNRNALLLHTVGECVVSVDDDVLCQIAPAPNASNGLVLSSLANPVEFWFHPSVEEMTASSRVEEVDFIARHERLLGRKVGDCIAGWKDDLDVTGMDISFSSRAGHVDARVALTVGGLRGDHGLQSSLYCLSLSGASRDRLRASEAHYLAALADRQVVRAVTRHTLSSQLFGYGPDWGFDNRTLLPPFFPAGRAEDNAFSQIVEKCFPAAFMGALPSTVLHEPLPRRSFSLDGLLPGLGTLEMRELLIPMIRTAPTVRDRRAPGRQLEILAEYFDDLATLALPALVDRVGSLYLRGQCGRLGDLERDFPAGVESPRWNRDGRAVFEALRGAVQRSPAISPAEFCVGRSSDEGMLLFQQFLGKFAALLRSWTILVEGAAQLRQEGIRIAVPA